MVAVAIALMPIVSSASQNGDTTPEINAERIQARLDALDPTDTAAADLYREALSHIDRANTAKARADDFRRQAADAPNLLESIRKELAEPAATPKPEIAPDASLIQYEQNEAQAAAQLTAARDRVAELQAEAPKRQERRTQIPTLLAQTRQQLTELDETLRAPPGETETAADAARRVLLAARRRALSTEIDSLEAELASYDARRELLPVRLDRAARRVSEAERLVAAWRDLVSARRQQEAERATREAERLRLQAAREHPVLQEFAAESKQIAEARTTPEGIPQKISRAKQQHTEINTRLVDLRRRYAEIRERIEASGLNRATGLVLRREFESLPDAGVLRRSVRDIQENLEDGQYTLIERQQLRSTAGDTESVTLGLLEEISGAGAAQPELESVARELALARRDLLGDLVSDSKSYTATLEDLDRSARALLEATIAYRSFISERILWVRSISAGRALVENEGKTLGGDRLSFAVQIERAARWQLDPASWSDAWSRTQAEILRHPSVSSIIASLIFAGHLLIVPAMRRLRLFGRSVGRYSTDAFRHTVGAILVTLLVATPTPALIWVLGWVLTRPADQPAQAFALGMGLRAAGLLLFPLLIARHLVCPGGVADEHFRWSQPAMRMFRRQLRWFVPVFTPLVAVIVAIDERGDESANASLGRLVFTAAMIVIAVFQYRVVRPKGPVLGEFIRRHEGAWVDRLRFVWFPLLVALPIAFAAVAWLGYYYTAIQLQARFELTLVLLLALVFVNGVLMRWLFVARRRVAVEEAKRRRESATQEPTADDGPTERADLSIDEDKLDLPAISLQTTQLFRVAILTCSVIGLYAIWADVLPALRMLDRVVVFPEIRIVESDRIGVIPVLEPGRAGGVTGVSGETAPPPASEPASADKPAPASAPLSGLEEPAPPPGAAPLAVTIADVGLALVLLIVTVAAFRNLPGLIEIAVLQRLPLDAGSRYALSTVIRYLIAIVGIAAAFGAVGISWNRVQWLAAALTFGLAFGLQEIFANFVSGLIILAERPVRIGDTVTIGEVSGTITRVRMRATTITDWDRKELVIPNKSFITGEVINWTLSDPTLRITIPVGVSYGADVRMAEAILFRVASEQPNVLGEPKPQVVFNAFGDSTLDFRLRVFIPHIDHLISVKHGLHMRITEAFREAGIEIAFPQRDLHIRSAEPLAELLRERGRSGQTTQEPHEPA